MMTYEFMSAGWFAALHGIISERVTRISSDLPALTFSVCEIAYDAPAHLGDGTGTLAWCCRVEAGRLSFALTADRTVDLMVEGDYRALKSLATIDTAGDPAREESFRRSADALIEAGKLKVLQSAQRPAEVGSFHNAIARLTSD